MSMIEAGAAVVFTVLCLVGKHEAAGADVKIDDPIESVLCEVESHFYGTVKCTTQGVLLKFGHCATYKEGDGVFISKCPYFQLEGHNISDLEPGYIQLPDNISELNDYMCGPMNRKGFLCKDCIDGFGPSVTSLGYKCSNCTDVWYGIPLYLAVELIPITLFYLIILVFKVHLTSAPMTLLILYCHLMMYNFVFERNEPIDRLLSPDEHSPLFIGMLTLLGIWNLDFVHYITPPFCVSSKLLPSHVQLLDYGTTFYPLLLILITCTCIELHGRNCRLLVWLWKPFHKSFSRFHRKWDTRNDIIDVFASFFLLFYVKILYLGSVVLKCYPLKYTLKGMVHHKCANIDGNFSKFSYSYLTVPLIIVFNVLPVLLLVLYPFKLFRKCLSKCKLDRLFVTIFVEKFHGCYRDGLDSGRDMRSFSGFYFLLALLVNQTHHRIFRELKVSSWLALTLVFLAFALLIAHVQPYKKKYINVLDSLLLAYLTVLCLLLSRDYFPGDDTQILVMLLFPTAVFGVFVVFKIIAKYTFQLLKWYKYCCKSCKRLFRHNKTVAVENYRSRQLFSPTATVVDIRKYGTFSEVSIQ